MKNECHIVRDLMPLYTEGMLSNESAAFVKTHLETCEDCRAAYGGEETPPVTEADTAQQRAGEAGVLRTLKKKLRKQTLVRHHHYSGGGAAGDADAEVEFHRLSGGHQL